MPPGATSWLLIGSAFLLASSPGERSRRRALVPVLALTTAAIATLSITGYIYGASSLFTLPTLTVIALQTATFILAISVGLLLSVAEQGPIRLLREQGPAGILVRRILPALVVVPFVVGLLRLSGERAGLYDLAFGTAMRTIVEIALLLGLLFWTAGTISRHARARERAERSVEASEQRLRTIFETVGVALWEQDISGVQAMLAELRSEG